MPYILKLVCSALIRLPGLVGGRDDVRPGLESLVREGGDGEVHGDDVPPFPPRVILLY